MFSHVPTPVTLPRVNSALQDRPSGEEGRGGPRIWYASSNVSALMRDLGKRKSFYCLRHYGLYTRTLITYTIRREK
ncbi:hypothetical protein JTE90_009906 [Oedothorax gibbosus]|uniref:Uncharacterized protein n=1 Tax=Oedothorax gibbosus TaxID=931172 RepID=A0AAV6UUB8_9ARAC|nr:hypothetical protein JTE90_009906 [Oedothorax gibbosus]